MRKRSHFSLVLYTALAAVPAGCSSADDINVRQICGTRLEFTADALPGTRAADPQENLISDMNLFIFNSADQLEQHMFLACGDMTATGSGYSYEVSLLENCTYSVYACANIGYRLNVSCLEELLDTRYFFAYPDDYRTGLPMSGTVRFVAEEGMEGIAVPMERLVAKVSVCIDRSRLNSDVEFTVKSVKVGACSKSVMLFRDSRVSVPDETFISGFTRSGQETDCLNMNAGFGKSLPVHLYMLENMQGNQLYGAVSYRDKFFADGDQRADICSFVEIHIDYLSGTHQSLPGKDLTYRFYLGDDECNFDVRRNTHYSVTVTPEGDGLQDSGWRVDKDDVVPSGAEGRSPVISDIWR